jgi:hypothetical protein
MLLTCPVIESLNEWLNLHYVVVVVAAGILFLAMHFYFEITMEFPFNVLIPILAILTATIFFILFFHEEERIEVMQAMMFLYLYIIALYITLCDILLNGFARYLTRKFGENWVKAMDYFYLTLGTLGIFGSLNRVDIFTGRMSRADVIAPLVLATAIVIRYIKTRADIGGWNKK